jgi:hypothetical protein
MERHLRAAVVFSALDEGTSEIRRDINGGIHGL